MSRKVFVLGATGYLGSAITARLVRGGFDVRGLTRSEDGVRTLAALGARGVLGKLDAPDDWIGEMQNCDVAVHAAVDYSNPPAQDQHALAAVKLAATDGRVRRLLYTSGLWDYGRASGVVDESAPLHPLPLVQWRTAHLDVALDLGVHEVEVVIVQPAMVYGESRGILGGLFAEAHAKKTVTYWGDGAQHWSLVHRDDVADAYALALEHGTAGERYIVAEDATPTLEEIAEAIARVTGATARAWPAEEVLAKLGPYGEALMASLRVSAVKAKRDLGWVPRATPFVAAVEALDREWLAGQKTPVG